MINIQTPLSPDGITIRSIWTSAGVALAVSVLAWGTLAWVTRHPVGSPLVIVAIIQAAAWIGLYRMQTAWVVEATVAESKFVSFFLLAALVRLIAALALPILDDDFARYLWDGWRMSVSGNPYEHAPVHYFGDPAVPAALQWVLDAVNNPHIPTLYGPGFQLWFGLAALIAPGSLLAFKAVLLAVDLGVILLLRQLWGARVALLYAWCPLVIFETGFNAHAEVLALLPLLLGIAFQQRSRPFVAGLLLGISVASKVSALPAVPFILRWPNVRGWLGFVTGVVGFYLPFWMQTGHGDRAGLAEFLGAWEFNSSMVGLLGLVLPPSWARGLPLVVTAAILGCAWLRSLQRPACGLRLDAVFGLVLTASAVVNPWYLLWIVPFAALQPTRTAWTALIAVSLSYATSMNLGLDLAGPYDHPVWVRVVEYGAILTAFALDIRSRTWRRLR